MRNRFFIITGLALLALVLVACGGAADGGDGEGEGSIWVLLPDSASSARWETDDRRFFEQAFEAAGVEYNIVNAEGDSRTQQTQAEQAITAGAKVILLVNLDSGSAAAIIADAHEAGVKVVDYDRLTIEGEGADVYVSFDNEQVGATMADVLVPLINAQDDPKVVLLNGGPTDNNSTLFRNGYYGASESFFDDGSWTLVDDQSVPEWDNQQALVIFEQILTAAENDVSAVYAANDGLAGAVISAFKNAGIDPGDAGIPISGQDATVGGVQNVLAGDQAMSVYKPIKAEAEAAAEAAVALLRGEDLAALSGGLTINNGTNDLPFIALTPIGLTADNVGSTVIADGFRTWEEICVGDFAMYCPEESGLAEEMMEEAMVGTADDPIVWILTPSQDTETVLAGAEALAQHIEDETGLVIEPIVATDFSAQVEALCAGEAQMGAINTFGYIRANERGCADAALASVRFGSSTYAGQIITQAGSGIESIADVAGKTFCRPDPGSTSGWVIPQLLMLEAGIDPETDLEEIVDAGGHDAVVIAVYNGDCDAGSTFEDARSNVADEFEDVNEKVVVVQTTAPIPNDAVAFAPDFDADARAEIVSALLLLNDSDAGVELLSGLFSWSGLQDIGDSFYDGFRQQLEAAGVTVDDL